MPLEGRSRQLVAGVTSSIPSRAIALLAPLLLIPFALSSLGSERFGLWSTAMSVSAFAVFADLGIGNGLLTKLTQAVANGQFDDARRLVSSAYAFTAVLAAILALLAIPGLTLLASSQWTQSQTIPIGEVIGIVASCVYAFIVGVPIGLIQRTQYASDHVPRANLWLAIASLVSAFSFVGLRMAGFGVVVSVAASAFTFPAIGLINSVDFYTRACPELRPFTVRPAMSVAGQLARMGVMFLFIGVATAVGLQMDLTVISGTLGLSYSGEYAVALRITGMLSSFFMLICLPIWPASGAALATGDVAWVRRMILRMTGLAVVVVGVPGILLATVLRPVIVTWLGTSDAAPSVALLLALVLWNCLVAASSPIFMVQNSAGVLWPQLVGWSLFAVLALSLKILILPTAGLVAAPLISSVCMAVVVFPAAVFGYRKSLAAPRQPIGDRQNPELMPSE